MMMRPVNISPALQEVIEQFLVASNFSRYRELSELLRDRHGLAVSKTWLHLHTQEFRSDYRAAQRLATRSRALVAAGVGSDSPLFNRALDRFASELEAAAAVSDEKTKKSRHNARRGVAA
jgi:hypothetical protein